MALKQNLQQVSIEFLIEKPPFQIPPFQRGFVWDRKKMNGLIWSVLEGYGMPSLTTVKIEGERGSLLLDGLQRFTTIKKFIDNEFALDIPEEINISPELIKVAYKKKFKDLPEELQDRILNHLIDIKVYEVPKEEKSKYLYYATELFKRLNMKPTPLKKGHLLYLFTYIPNLWDKLREVSLSANGGEDKQWGAFRTLARYLAVILRYDQIKNRELKWNSSTFYTNLVGNTLLELRQELESAKKKERKGLEKAILDMGEAFEVYSHNLVEYIREVEEQKLQKEFDKIYQQELEKQLKKLERTAKRIEKKEKISHEEALEKARKLLESQARREAERKISSGANKKAKSFIPSKKVWIADFFAVLERKRQELGIKPEEAWEQFGKETFERLMLNEEFFQNVQNRKAVEPRYMIPRLEMMEKAVSKVLREEENIAEAIDKVIEAVEEKEEKQAESETPQVESLEAQPENRVVEEVRKEEQVIEEVGEKKEAKVESQTEVQKNTEETNREEVSDGKKEQGDLLEIPDIEIEEKIKRKKQRKI